MCDQNSLQQHIRELTNNGEVIARFLVNTVQGKTPHAKPCHQLEATKQLTRLGALNNTNPVPTERAEPPTQNTVGATLVVAHPNDDSVHGEPTHNPVRPEPVEGHAPTDQSRDNHRTHPVTYLDILNHELAQLVRSETAEGHTIAEFLYNVVTGKEEPFTPKRLRIKPADRMAAAMEILRRGYGHFGRRRKLIDDSEETNDYDTLHTDLAKRMRQYGDHGSDVIRFLLDVMHNTYPNEEFTMRHRVSAAQELTRRGWDTNFDKIKMEHLVDYWRDQQDAILSVGQKKDLAGLHTFADEYEAYDDKTLKDYKALAQQLHAQQDRESEERERQRKERQRKERQRKERQRSDDSVATTPLPPQGEGQEGGKKDENPTHPIHHASSDPDPDQDFYYEPLSPEDQALFDYYDLIESGNYKEGEIHPRPVTETMRLGYQATLTYMRQSAQAEGIPLLPNPLSGTLKHPNPTARSP